LREIQYYIGNSGGTQGKKMSFSAIIPDTQNAEFVQLLRLPLLLELDEVEWKPENWNGIVQETFWS
jgi:hypothetical protein